MKIDFNLENVKCIDVQNIDCKKFKADHKYYKKIMLIFCLIFHLEIKDNILKKILSLIMNLVI